MEIIHSIFTSDNINDCISKYLLLFDLIESENNTPFSKEYYAAKEILKQATICNDSKQKNALIFKAIKRFRNACGKEHNERLLMAYLGLITCLHLMNKKKDIKKIQEHVQNIELQTKDLKQCIEPPCSILISNTLLEKPTIHIVSNSSSNHIIKAEKIKNRFHYLKNEILNISPVDNSQIQSIN